MSRRKRTPLPADPAERLAEKRRRWNEYMARYRERQKAGAFATPEARRRTLARMNAVARYQATYRDKSRLKKHYAEMSPANADNLDLVGL